MQQTYYFEAEDTIFSANHASMTSAGIEVHRVNEDFFNLDISVMVADGDARGIIIGDDGLAMRRIKSLRDARSTNPIIVIMDNRNAKQASQLLDAGADDVVVRPIRAEEILSRLNAISRRYHGFASASVEIGDIVAYLDGSDPIVCGESVSLSKIEHKIFTYLVRHHKQVVTKEKIFNAVYGLKDDAPFDKVIDVFICKIRKKLSGLTTHSYIETIWGRGYKLDVPKTLMNQRLLAAPAPEAVAAEPLMLEAPVMQN
jgi:two-component system cell cycle response regulator CtrA